MEAKVVRQRIAAIAQLLRKLNALLRLPLKFNIAGHDQIHFANMTLHTFHIRNCKLQGIGLRGGRRLPFDGNLDVRLGYGLFKLQLQCRVCPILRGL